MSISKIQAFFAQLNNDSDKSVSSQETVSPDNSIFGAYLRNNGSLDSETFSSLLGFNPTKVDVPDYSIITPRQVPYEQHDLVKLTTVPPNPEKFEWFIPWAKGDSCLVDLRGNDASGLDLSKSEKLLSMSDFDNHTKFPAKDKLPKDFDPQQMLQSGKDPGLGLKKLHQQGFTGKGVNIAVIDSPISLDHSEFKDNVPSYNGVGIGKNQVSEMHGMAVSSIIAGKNVGVAPDAHLEYYAANPRDMKTGQENVQRIAALKIILEKNDTLPPDKKIQAVSMSWGVPPSDPNYKEFQDTVKKLEDKGVFVLSCQEPYPHNFNFEGLTRDPKKDPNDPKSYKLTGAVAQQIGEDGFAEDKKGNVLLVPSSNRTVAGQTDKNNYTLYADGGTSWQAPYIVGAYALAKQANPNLTPDEFRKKSLETGTPYYSPNGELVGKIINPEKLIEEVSKK